MHTPYETCFRLSLINLSYYKMRTLMAQSSSTIFQFALFASVVVQNRKSRCPGQPQSVTNDPPFFCLHLRLATTSLVWYWLLHVRLLWQYPFIPWACRWLPPLMFPSTHTPNYRYAFFQRHRMVHLQASHRSQLAFNTRIRLEALLFPPHHLSPPFIIEIF